MDHQGSPTLFSEYWALQEVYASFLALTLLWGKLLDFLSLGFLARKMLKIMYELLIDLCLNEVIHMKVLYKIKTLCKLYLSYGTI